MSAGQKIEDLMGGYDIQDHWAIDRKLRRKQEELKAVSELESALGRIMAPADKATRFLKYREFLKTPYWRTVRHAAYRAFGRRCIECGRGGRVDVHHLTYEHHGDELRHLDDLTVLCRVCHGAAHNLAICPKCEHPKGKGMALQGKRVVPCPACWNGGARA